MLNNSLESTLTERNHPSMILTTGLYDLLKDHIRRRKLSKEKNAALEIALKQAKQVLRKDLPQNVVTTNTRVSVKEIESDVQFEYRLVGPAKARRKNNTMSILSPEGVSLLGYAEGDTIAHETPEGVRSWKIVKVEKLP